MIAMAAGACQVPTAGVSRPEMEHAAMSAPSVTLTPLTGRAINDMILDFMSASNNRRKADLARFLESGRTVQSELMAITLRGMILQTSA